MATIAMAGKGGTGKTTVSALIVRYLVNHGGSVLAVDADPNTNLSEALGLAVEETVGGVTEELLKNIDDLPAGMSKDTYMEYNIQRVVSEGPKFDMISMGRPEGQGCYCYPNSLVRKYMDMLAKNYDYVVADNEAGMEHLSRRTTRDVDFLIVVSDASVRGVRIAAHLGHMVDDLKINVARRLLIVNRAAEPLAPAIMAAIEESGLTFAGTVPGDAGIERCDLEDLSVFDLADDSPAVVAVDRIIGEALAEVTAASGS
jgi:CO dehydrogenase maturation factor